jgi:hypothetical protein
MWLETEALVRMAERQGRGKVASRRSRQPLVCFSGPADARRVVGRGLIALGERLATVRPVAEQPAA